jgi:hypothetical protein
MSTNPGYSSATDAARQQGYDAVYHERPLYAPRNPYDETDPRHDEWEEGAMDGGICRDYTNGVRNDGRERGTRL